MRARSLFLLASLAATPAATAAPFATFDQGALARGFALPTLGEATVLGDGQSSLRWTWDLTNEYVRKARGAEEIVEDGESQRLALRYAAGFGSQAEWSVEVPLLHVGGGFLDGFIEDWHDWFGLPNGGREDAGHGEYAYRYTRGGVAQLEATDTGMALGDVLLGAGWQWLEGVAVRGQLKLPTGNQDKLAGHNLGGAVWADVALPFDAGSRWSGHASAGVSVNDRGEVLPDQQRRVLPIAGAGLSWRAMDQLDLGAQLAARGKLFDDSQLDALDRPGVQLVFGGAWHAGFGRVEVALQEDIVTESSPDFSVHLGLTLAPDDRR